jgi:uncharacterized protein YmfQ (DUF2313 family)
MRTAEEYLKLLRSLLPKGWAWNDNVNSTLTEFLYAEAEEFARVDQRSEDLLVERNTLYTNELLTDHENDLGLPDECSPEDETIQERRDAVHSKFIQLGQQNPQYYIDIAAAMGWTITITEFSPFISGVSASGDSCGDSEVIFYWQINIDLVNVKLIEFSSGNSQSGDQISFYPGVDQLICTLNKLKPAHTILIYTYTGPSFGADFDESFDSLPSGGETYLTGPFDQSFGLGLDVHLGGAFNSKSLGISFKRPGYNTNYTHDGAFGIEFNNSLDRYIR